LDALTISLRGANIISSFSVGNFVNSRPSIVAQGNPVDVNLRVLSTGDVNGSYSLPVTTPVLVLDTVYSTFPTGTAIVRFTTSGSGIYERGVCWGTSPNPTISVNKSVAGTGGFDFTHSFGGLTGGTQYYVRAYARNSAGTYYSNERGFTTGVSGFQNVWLNSYSTQSGGFGRGMMDGNNVVISGATWPTHPNGTTNQMITKIDSSGQIIFQVVRAPGWDHDGYSSVVKLDNGNYGFFGQQNAQGSLYFDAVFTVFSSAGVEQSNHLFLIPGSSSGSDMKKLPNGNLVFTGNHGGNLNFVAITNQQFVQLAYVTFPVGSWNAASLAIDTVNNSIYAVGSTGGNNAIHIRKYDYNLNVQSSFSISHNEEMIHYDAIVHQNKLLICGRKKINGVVFGFLVELDSTGSQISSHTSPQPSAFTALCAYNNSIIAAKSNLNGEASVSNEVVAFSNISSPNVSFTLNNGSPLVPFHLLRKGSDIYVIGCIGQYHWIGIPAIQKIRLY